MKSVLDASALLSFLQSEPGGGRVEEALPNAVISSVNWAEVLQKSLAAQVDIDGMVEDLEALGLTISPFTVEDANTAARLGPQTRALGLSLGDRACLSLGLRFNLPVLTADRVWSRLDLPVAVQVIR